MKVKKKELQTILLIVLLYLAIGNFFYFIPESFLNIKGFGKVYDVVFIFLIILAVKKIKIGIRLFRKDALPMCIFLIYLIVECIRTVGQQSIVQSIRTIREFLLFFIFIFFATSNLKKERVLKLLLVLDLIGCCIYIFQFIIGKSILSAYYIFENLGELNVLRSYAFLPEFDVFFFNYLLLSIMQGKKVFSSKLYDWIALFLVTVACVLHFTRGLWIVLIAVTVIDILVFYGKVFSLKKIVYLALGLIVVFVVIPKIAPGIVDRMNLGLNQLGQGVGTAGVRFNLLASRFSYLSQNGSAWFGLGALNSDYNIDFNVGAQYLNQMSSADSAWANILVRYGIVGVVLSVIAFMFPAIRHLVKADKYNKRIEISYFMMVLSSLVLGFEGSAAFGGTSFLKFGIIYGIMVTIQVPNQ